MKHESRILISGAGVAGLTVALWLAKAGFRPVVAEIASSLRAGGYLVALSHHAYRFANELGLMEAIEPYDLNISSSSYHDKTGKALLTLDYIKLMKRVEVIQLMREDLVRVLYDKTKNDIDLRFQTTIKAIEQEPDGIDVTFSDGTTERFDLVIGCDGANSGIRELAFRPSEIGRHYLGLNCAAFRAPNVLGITSKFETHMERERYMATFTTKSDDLGCVFVWNNQSTDLPPESERVQVLRDAFKNSTPAILKALAHCPENAPFYFDCLQQIDMPSWRSGRVVLVGDAAHCLTLFSGRGAAAAFAGASRLAKALIDQDLDDALESYERQMRPIIDDIGPATRRAVRWYVPRSRLNHFIRDSVMRILPNALFRHYFRIKYSNV